jgi:hypothetical protein
VLAAHHQVATLIHILHPKVCAGAPGLFVSPTTEPLRVGVLVVAAAADIVSVVLCCVVLYGVVEQKRRRSLRRDNTTHPPQCLQGVITKGAFVW